MDSKNFSALEIDAIGEILNISLGASATAVSTMLSSRVDITTPIVRVLSRSEFEISNLEPAVGVEITYVTGLSGSNIMLLKRHDVKVIVDMLMGMETPEEGFELNELNISAICEVMNQMMGASATALSEFLNKTVNISTPTSFEVQNGEEFKEKYYCGEEDMVVIGFTLRIADKLESEFLNVMTPSLAKELVAVFLPDDFNQDETPTIVPVPEPEPEPAAPASSGGIMSQDEIERLLAGMGSGDAAPEEPAVSEPPVQPAPVSTPPVSAPVSPSQPAYTPAMPDMSGMMGMPGMSVDPMAIQQMMSQMQMQQQMINQMQQMMSQMQNSQAAVQPREPVEPKTINVKPMPQTNLKEGAIPFEEQEENRELIMGVPLEVSVEIGRTRKLVKEILEFTKGSLVVLDKLAGEQVDLFVNGQCIAKGDVVVIDDNFGIRITEIIKKNAE